jgi:peptide/nickel transport system substrate-binding protein
MQKRQFNKLLLSAGALTLADIPLGLSLAYGQTRGGTLNAVLQPEPPTLNIGVNQQTPTQTVSGKIFLSLLTYDFDMKPMPSLAKSWTISPDGKTYTFVLERDIKWHDGKPLTSEDVVYTAKEFLPVSHPRAKAIFERCESITATDAHTIVFKLKAPFAAFIGAFDISNMPIMPKHIYAGTDILKNPANLKPIGCGPYKFKEWVRGSHIHLVRNEQYFKPGKPYLDAVIYRIIPDGASRAVALENGTIQLTQWTDLELFDAQRLAKDPKLAMTTKGYEQFAPIMMVEMNVRNGPLQDKRFRQAISHAIDRQFIRDRILYGFGKLATGPICSKTPFYDGNVKKYDFSVAKATALMDEMGLKPDDKGVRARLRLPVAPYGEMPARACEYLRQALSKVGITVVLETSDAAGWAQKISNWDFDLNLNWPFQYGDPALGVTRNYVSSNIRKVLFSNVSGYSNPEVDRLADTAASEVDRTKRQAAYTEMQKILVEDSPIAWLVEMDFPTIHDKRVKGLVTTGIGIHESFDSVYFER